MPDYIAYAAIAQAVYLAREEMSLDAAATLHGLIYGDERITTDKIRLWRYVLPAQG